MYGLGSVTRHPPLVTKWVTPGECDVTPARRGYMLPGMPAPAGVRAINGPPATIASIVLVVLCYVAASGGVLPVDQTLLPIESALYLAGLLAGPIVVERFAWGRAVYFPAQLALTALLLAQGPVAMALAPMALISHAVLYLRPRHAALLIGAVAALTLVGLSAAPDWATRIGSALSYATAVTFVVGFSRIAAGHYDERQRATRLAAELAVAVDQIAALASAQERNRIAREVHDGLGHTLTVVHVQLEAARDLIRRDPERAEQILARVQGVVQGGLRDVRGSVGLLRDDSRPRALPAAIAACAAELRADGIAVALDLPATAQVAPAAAHVLYRAAQEAMTNVRKHAAARSVAIAMADTADGWRLRIADDGRGADDARAAAGFGLAGIRERVAALGGRVEVETRPGAGFALTLEVPRAPVPGDVN
jgi:signal transduction histidine kinase